MDAWRAVMLFPIPIGQFSSFVVGPPRPAKTLKPRNSVMSKINRFAVPAFALVAGLSVGSAVGSAQTSTTPAQSEPSGKAAQPAAPMMGGPGRGMMGPGMMSQGGMGPGMMGMGPGMMGMGPGMGMMSEGGMGMMGPAMCAAMAGHVDARLAYLKADLKITDAQEPLWKAYAAAARDNAQDMQKHCTAMKAPAGLSLPERMDQRAQFMAARLDALRATNRALKPLYDALSADQKKIAEQMRWGPAGVPVVMPMGMPMMGRPIGGPMGKPMGKM
jgi:LTXXQ motif family protein